MEPYIRHDIDQDTLVLLQTQMDDLSEMIETALTDTDTGVNTVTARLNAISDYLNAAGASVRSVRTSGSLSTRISAEAQGEGSAEGSLVFEVPSDQKDFALGFEEYYEDESVGDLYVVYFTAE